ncbi:MAG: Crp/Fnr family transcriptional regulator [Limnohabitans sp.]|nr:Crp/Fnr family transcriptional regulator [Limnohabitans sp.]
MKTFIEYINSISKLSQLAIQDIEECAFVVNVTKKQILIPELSKSQYLYFISKGVVRAYFYHNGKEITDWFGTENMVIGPTIRNFPVKETIHAVETLEECELVRISFSDLEQLYQKHHDIERLGRIIAIQNMLHLQYKIDSLQLLSAKERYIEFIKQYPNLINRVPLGFISSYLGMNQVTLSRIRKTA